MRALTFQGIGNVQVKSVPDPQLQEATDALIRVNYSAVCGSDLHVYHGRIVGVKPDEPIGHEYAGVVHQVGSAVRRFQAGDRVTGSFFTACGHCWACDRGLYSQCVSAALFGFGERFGDLPGSQAEWLRVPNADYTLCALPDDVTFEQGLFVGDVLATAFFATQRGGIHPGDTVAIIGAGPVGLMMVECALVFGAASVIILDRVPERLALAEMLGAVPIMADESAPKKVRSLTHGQGADVVLEAVGTVDSLSAAFQVARGFATVSAAGIFSERTVEVSMGRAFAKDLTLRAGMANVQAQFGPVLELIRHKRLKPEALISHRVNLEDGARAYDLFESKKGLKVVLEIG